MSARPSVRRSVAVAALLTLAVPAAAQARDMYATDTAGAIHRFDSQFPGRLLDTVDLQLPPGVSLRGIDFRPATGDLIGVGTDAVLYAVNPATGATRPLGAAFRPGITGASLGVDTNPAADALRVVSDAEDNFRLGFATGNHGAGSPDGRLNPGDPSVVGSAYTNSSLSATRPTVTQLFAIDSASDALLLQSPPNAGTLTAPKPLGVDIGPVAGFDIAGPLNEGWMVAVPSGARGSSLYRVNLASGAATAVGPVATGRLVRGAGGGRVVLTGLAARLNVGAPLAANVEPHVQVVRTTLRPRAGQNAAYIARAGDPDGAVTQVEWDADGDGAFDDATGFSARITLRAGVSQIAVRATDDAGARTVGSIRVRVPGAARG